MNSPFLLKSAARRAWLGVAAAATALLLAGCAAPAGDRAAAGKATAPGLDTHPPIVFVHGNGDHAGLWINTIQLFESNGWPRGRLHAFDLAYPLARDADDKPQPGRSSTEDHRHALADAVARVRAATGAQQVVLFANSRGGNAIRNFVANGGAAQVSHAILGGTPNHGVWINAGFRPTNEFNGASPFLTALNNQGAPGVEITPGPRWMTIRSEDNDLYAHPDGRFIGAPGTPTGVTAAGPELKGALNVVIPRIDHRETSYSPQAFAAAHRFITGREAATLAVTPEGPRVTLDGLVSGRGLDNDPAKGGFQTNLPLVGAQVEVWAVDAASGERQGGAPLHRKTVGADGRWGPALLPSGQHLEFVLSAPGYATSHVYRQPFARGSSVVNLRAELLGAAERSAGSVVVLVRPRGYFSLPRDRVVLDGREPAPGIPPGVAAVNSSRLVLPAAPPRSVVGEFNQHRLAGRSWPAAENRLVFLELGP